MGVRNLKKTDLLETIAEIVSPRRKANNFEYMEYGVYDDTKCQVSLYKKRVIVQIYNSLNSQPFPCSFSTR